MRRLALAAFRFGVAGITTGVIGLFGRQPRWVDDGVCTCTDCTGPSWLRGDNAPATGPLPDGLRELEEALTT